MTTPHPPEPTPRGEVPKGMTLDIARSMFDEMSADEAPDFSLTERTYHPDVCFQDPIQSLEGRDAFIEMSRRLVERCRELRGRANDVAQTGNVIFVQWTMEMKMGPAPLSVIEGVTKLRLDDEGLVIEHRDYFDLWGDTLGSAPGIGGLYRRLVRRMG